MILAFEVRLKVEDAALFDTPAMREATREWLLSVVRHAAGPDVVVDVAPEMTKGESRMPNAAPAVQPQTTDPRPQTPSATVPQP